VLKVYIRVEKSEDEWCFRSLWLALPDKNELVPKKYRPLDNLASDKEAEWAHSICSIKPLETF
jgi:hypothetical protein